jgi:hypothetical protein
MPPTTRSKAAKTSSSTSTPEESTRESSTARSRKAQEASQLPSSLKTSTRQLPAPRFRKAKEPSHHTSTLSEELTRVYPANAIVHWPCQSCSCPQGTFVPPVNACIFCEHNMQDHELHDSDSIWNPYCDYVSEREDLVAATIQLALERRVVVIRATPLVGKTTLLRLLGRHIRDKLHSLEPVWIHWKCREERNGLDYLGYLENEAMKWRGRNARHRPHNPNARKIFLIDEAQNSYPEADFWSHHLKNTFTRSQSLFVLVCVYGSATEFLAGGDTNTQSEAIRIDPSQRIELRPSVTGGLSMLFTMEETTTSVKKWALWHNYELTDGVCEYIQTATGGHPGMIGLLFLFFNSRFPQVNP